MCEGDRKVGSEIDDLTHLRSKTVWDISWGILVFRYIPYLVRVSSER